MPTRPADGPCPAGFSQRPSLIRKRGGGQCLGLRNATPGQLVVRSARPVRPRGSASLPLCRNEETECEAGVAAVPRCLVFDFEFAKIVAINSLVLRDGLGHHRKGHIDILTVLAVEMFCEPSCLSNSWLLVLMLLSREMRRSPFTAWFDSGLSTWHLSSDALDKGLNSCFAMA